MHLWNIFDFAKAFDTVYHNVLLEKFEKLGLQGIRLQWFAEQTARI